MQIETFIQIMKICNNLMNYKLNIFGLSVSLYEFIFYQLLIVVVLGAVYYLFRNN